MTCQPTGQATIVVRPSAEEPRCPVTVVIQCGCGNSDCYWTVTGYEPLHVPARCIHPGVFATDQPTTHCHHCGIDVPRQEL